MPADLYRPGREIPRQALETHLTRNDSNIPRSALSCTSLYHSSNKRVCILPVHHRQHNPSMLTHRYICVYVYIPILTHTLLCLCLERGKTNCLIEHRHFNHFLQNKGEAFTAKEHPPNLSIHQKGERQEKKYLDLPQASTIKISKSSI